MNGERRTVFSVAVYAWSVAIVFAHVVGCVLMLPWTVLFDRDRRAAAAFGSALVRASLRVPRSWRRASRGIAAVDLTRPAVIVMNHRSIADIALALALPGAPRLAAKPWVARVPLLGAAMRLGGHLVFDPSDLGEIRALLERAEGLVRGGVSVVFFPEGARQTGPGLGRFDEGAFEVAVRAGADVLPVLLTRTGGLVPKHTFVFHAVEPSVAALERIPAGTDRRALCRRVRDAMLRASEEANP